jgi:periplasmic divalent cation tolerance protein
LSLIAWSLYGGLNRFDRRVQEGAPVTDKVVVLMTAGSLKEARKIARALVEARLAACVNLLPNMESIYRWQGKIESSNERLLVVKTSREIFPQVETEIRKLHTYATPEIICLPIIDGSRDYLAWLEQCLGKPAEQDEITSPVPVTSES